MLWCDINYLLWPQGQDFLEIEILTLHGAVKKGDQKIHPGASSRQLVFQEKNYSFHPWPQKNLGPCLITPDLLDSSSVSFIASVSNAISWTFWLFLNISCFISFSFPTRNPSFLCEPVPTSVISDTHTLPFIYLFSDLNVSIILIHSFTYCLTYNSLW